MKPTGAFFPIMTPMHAVVRNYGLACRTDVMTPLVIMARSLTTICLCTLILQSQFGQLQSGLMFDHLVSYSIDFSIIICQKTDSE